MKANPPCGHTSLGKLIFTHIFGWTWWDEEDGRTTLKGLYLEFLHFFPSGKLPGGARVTTPVAPAPSPS
jgi:hypothetical protein